jgi:hypothetical protein
MSRTSPAGTPLGDEFHLYDTTLRAGAQREKISYSVADKLAVARLLDTLAVGFIEGGWPGAPPKDTEFFNRAAAGELDLRHAVLVAFGSTRRAALKAAQDPQMQALLVVPSSSGHGGRQVRPAARGAGAAGGCRAGLRDGHRHRRAAGRCGPEGLPRRRALLRWLRLRCRLRAAGAGGGGDRRCRRGGALRHQRGAAAAAARRDRRRGGGPHRLPGGDPLPGRHRRFFPSTGWPS